MNIKDFTVEIATDLYKAGYDEDGREFHAEAYWIEVTNYETGERWRMRTGFPGAERHRHPEDCFYIYADIRPEQLARAERLAARIRAAGEINPDHWSESDPVYGSSHYVRSGAESAQIQRERMEG